MGYFSNGTEGMMYEEEWCSKCLHHDDCIIWTAHLARNYQECNNKDSILHMLIPRSKNGIGNEKCRMFIDSAWLSPLSLQHFKSKQAEGE